MTDWAKTQSSPLPKIINWLASKKQRIQKSDYTKQTLFYNFPLNIRVQMHFRATNPALNCDPLCLKRIADSLDIPPELQHLGHRAILTQRWDRCRQLFSQHVSSHLWSECCEGRLVKVSLTIDAVLVNLRATSPPLKI